MAASIPLRNKHGEVVAHTILDWEDFWRVAMHRWYRLKNGYVVRTVGLGKQKKMEYLHRTVMGLPIGRHPKVDHENGNPLDNRRSNLRLGTQAQNAQNKNRGYGGLSPYRGVTWDKRREKWVAQATVNYRSFHIGRFETEEDAAQAAVDFRAKYMEFSAEAKGQSPEEIGTHVVELMKRPIQRGTRKCLRGCTCGRHEKHWRKRVAA